MNNKPTPLVRTCKNIGLLATGFLAAAGLLSLTHISPADAQAPGTSLPALLARLKADEAVIASQATSIAALQAKTAPLSVSSDPNAGGTNTLLTISGVNVQIVNGLGATNGEPKSPNDTDNPIVNGLGNLIIGYNERSQFYATARGGSHNLIVGTGNNYSSCGGLVAGSTNAIGAPFASVTGGYRNLASGLEASISGGYQSFASGTQSSVTGGGGNTASGTQSSATGGKTNTASGADASVTGGYDNTASGDTASITGGNLNTASGVISSVSGGIQNTASGSASTVSGGAIGTAGGNNNNNFVDATTVSGGYNRNQSNLDGWTGGGYHSDNGE